MRMISGAAALSLAVVMTAHAPGAARAEGLVLSSKPQTSVRSRESLFRSQTALMDSRLSAQYAPAPGGRVEAGDAAGLGLAGVTPRYSGNYRGQYLRSAKAAAARHNVPEDLFLRLVQAESGWNPVAISPKGARGLAQLMPETAALLGVNPMDPEENLEGGARYLRMMYDRFGNWRLALAAYNAGPGAVDQHGDIPPFAETRNYVQAVFGG
ncbi:lytic transglycosylase domain-containing protein [Paenirhodobacter enshiensis]|uniref:Lytic transglycosylase n=1 Tax=Paenirhodobacter enshiensis TaxID=1105367 RepID=A0A086XWS0_9RHOB|nr:lytic transglycosylase domain-containing protein [Paenirhodobacter enshiensis]KFI26470.1 lytic transglycosylase [Paenirhodobacter enshiensis]